MVELLNSVVFFTTIKKNYLEKLKCKMLAKGMEKKKVIHMRQSTCNIFILDMQGKLSECTNLKQAAVYK